VDRVGQFIEFHVILFLPTSYLMLLSYITEIRKYLMTSLGLITSPATLTDIRLLEKASISASSVTVDSNELKYR
jgi:hypothetical protein